ncbi:MAG TPA: ATP-binding cassette domain-containing protein [Alphaproteobacteria bacterium]|nr:ATP-binding cassette domain-containing protein [Alphaproteobacteria bacterium]
MLEIENLTVRYGGTALPALQGLSLAVEPGERVAIIGPSGAGKTTLFRAIGGFVPIESGRIAVAGMDVGSTRGRRLRDLRRRVAMIAQRHDVVERLRVYQNVMAGALGRWSALRAFRFLLWPLGSELDEARAALERVGIPEKLHDRTGALSGGQQQRVAIARALVQKPVMLLADEPVASLDPALADHILSLLCGLTREAGIGLLCSLHQHDLARQHFDRVLRLERGDAAGRAAANAGLVAAS